MTPDHLDCRDLLTSLWDCRDGRGSPDVVERVEAHLTACAPCHRMGEFQHRFFASLAELRTRSPAPGRVHDRVRKALAAARRGNSFSPQGLYS